jgi:hypothetical protein
LEVSQKSTSNFISYKYRLFHIPTNLKIEEQIESVIGQGSSPAKSQVNLQIKNENKKPEKRKIKDSHKRMIQKRPQTSRIHQIRPISSLRRGLGDDAQSIATSELISK